MDPALSRAARGSVGLGGVGSEPASAGLASELASASSAAPAAGQQHGAPRVESSPERRLGGGGSHIRDGVRVTFTPDIQLLLFHTLMRCTECIPSESWGTRWMDLPTWGGGVREPPEEARERSRNSTKRD